jgi:probable rRNA maturation factor
MINYNIEISNEYASWTPERNDLIAKAKAILDFYLTMPEIVQNCPLKDYEYNSISFDIFFCDGEKTHQINKEYRNKDYPADIITFAVFADSPEDERFVLELDINLGEVIIGLDRVCEEATKKRITKDEELIFLISHGIMHLLGFDHQTQEEFEFVVSCQKLALKSIGIEYDKV